MSTGQSRDGLNAIFILGVDRRVHELSPAATSAAGSGTLPIPHLPNRETFPESDTVMYVTESQSSAHICIAIIGFLREMK